MENLQRFKCKFCSLLMTKVQLMLHEDHCGALKHRRMKRAQKKSLQASLEKTGSSMLKKQQGQPLYARSQENMAFNSYWNKINAEKSKKLAAQKMLPSQIEYCGPYGQRIKKNNEEFQRKIEARNLQGRKTNIAPVDNTMGSERLADPKPTQIIQKFQILVSLILSMHDKDQTTQMVVGRLKEYGLTPQKIEKTSTEQLKQLIKQTTFRRRKAEVLIAVSETIVKQGKIADTIQEFRLKYPRVGVTTATDYLKMVEGKEQRFETNRIASMLGWEM